MFWLFTALHRGSICKILFRWIYYCHSSKFTGKKICKTHLSVHCLNELFYWSQIFCKFSAFSLVFQKVSRSLEQFFLTVGQNNFGNKISFLTRPIWKNMSTKYFILIFLQLFNLLSQLFVYEIPRRRPLKVLNYSKLALYESEWPSFLIIYIRSMWCLITFWFSALRLLPFLNTIFIYFFPIFQVSKFQIAMKWNIGKSFLHKAAKMTRLVFHQV